MAGLHDLVRDGQHLPPSVSDLQLDLQPSPAHPAWRGDAKGTLLDKTGRVSLCCTRRFSQFTRRVNGLRVQAGGIRHLKTRNTCPQVFADPCTDLSKACTPSPVPVFTEMCGVTVTSGL